MFEFRFVDFKTKAFQVRSLPRVNENAKSDNKFKNAQSSPHFYVCVDKGGQTLRLVSVSQSHYLNVALFLTFFFEWRICPINFKIRNCVCEASDALIVDTACRDWFSRRRTRVFKF